MKRVSFKIAKALKEAGYPQRTGKVYALQSRGSIKEGDVIDCSWVSINNASIPTYLETWLWLWREKKINIAMSEGTCVIRQHGQWHGHFAHSDPEEAIEKAIEYLCDNNLIK